MFDRISCREHYAVHIKTVFRLAEVLLNRVIFKKKSQLYLVFKNEYDYKLFDWISCRGHYAVHIKTVLCLAEILLNSVISNKRSQLCLLLKNYYD